MASADFKGLSILKTTDIVDVMKQSATENCISKSGNVGTITFTETIASANTVSDGSARSMSLASGGTLTVNNGSSNKRGSQLWRWQDPQRSILARRGHGAVLLRRLPKVSSCLHGMAHSVSPLSPNLGAN